MASIRAVKGKKTIKYRVEAMIDGVRIPSKTFDRKSEAELYAAQLKLQRQSLVGTNFRYIQQTTLSELIDEYLGQYRGKDTSLPQRLERWRVELGSLPIAGVTKDKVKKVLKKLLSDGLSNSTHNRYKSALSAVLSYADEEYDTDHNPCRRIRNKAEEQPVERWATSDELDRILSAAKQSSWPRLYLFILMAIHTGMRRGSLLELRWNSIDFNRSVAYRKTSKNAKPLALPLNEEVMVELEKFREIGSGFIFPHPSRLGENFRNFDYHWYKTRNIAALDENLRIHDLRHTTATWLVQASVPLTEVKQILSHKSILTTQRYIHHDTAGKAEKLRKVFGGIS